MKVLFAAIFFALLCTVYSFAGSVVLNGHTYDTNQFKGYGYTSVFPAPILPDMVTEIANTVGSKQPTLSNYSCAGGKYLKKFTAPNSWYCSTPAAGTSGTTDYNALSNKPVLAQSRDCSSLGSGYHVVGYSASTGLYSCSADAGAVASVNGQTGAVALQLPQAKDCSTLGAGYHVVSYTPSTGLYSCSADATAGSSGVTGPGSATVGHAAVFANSGGTSLMDGGLFLTSTGSQASTTGIGGDVQGALNAKNPLITQVILTNPGTVTLGVNTHNFVTGTGVLNLPAPVANSTILVTSGSGTTLLTSGAVNKYSSAPLVVGGTSVSTYTMSLLPGVTLSLHADSAATSWQGYDDLSGKTALQPNGNTSGTGAVGIGTNGTGARAAQLNLYNGTRGAGLIDGTVGYQSGSSWLEITNNTSDGYLRLNTTSNNGVWTQSPIAAWAKFSDAELGANPLRVTGTSVASSMATTSAWSSPFGGWDVAANSTNSAATNSMAVGREINVMERVADQGYMETRTGRATGLLQMVPESELDLSDGQGLKRGYNATFGLYFGHSGGSDYGTSGRTFPSAKLHIPILLDVDSTTHAGTQILSNGGSTALLAPNILLKATGYQGTGIDFSGATFAGSAIKLGASQTFTDGTVTKTLAQLAAGGGGGSGTVTSVTSANSDIGVASGSTAPVLTLNSSTTGGANKIPKMDGSGNLSVTVTDSDAHLTLANNSSTSDHYPSIDIKNYMGSGGGGPNMNMFDFGGSSASPSATLTGTSVFNLNGWAYGATGQQRVAQITAFTESNVSDTNNPATLTFNLGQTGGAGAVTERMRLTSAGWLGLGSTSPAAPLDITQAGASAINMSTTYSNGNNNSFSSSSVFRTARGTVASPLPVQTGDQLGALGVRGHTGAAFTTSSNAVIGMYAGENWIGASSACTASATPWACCTGAGTGTCTASNGTYAAFLTTANGGTTRSEKMRVHGSGGVSIGSTTDPGAGHLSMSGTAPTGKFGVSDATITTGSADNRGNMTWTGTSGGAATVTFANAWPAAPFCVCNAYAGASTISCAVTATSTTTATVSIPSSTVNPAVTWVCF